MKMCFNTNIVGIFSSENVQSLADAFTVTHRKEEKQNVLLTRIDHCF